MACYEPIYQRKQNDSQHQWTSIIHGRGCDWPARWERDPDKNIDDVGHREKVDRETPTTELEGTIGGVLASKFAEGQKADGDKVRDVEGDGGERDEGGKGNRGSDVDQGKQGADKCHEKQGRKRNLKSGVHLQFKLVDFLSIAS